MHSDTTDLFSLKSLRTLICVSDMQSLTRASIQLGLAQSAISRQLHELEEGFGGPLFHRHGRGVSPTELLVAMLPRIRALLTQAEELREASQVVAGTLGGTVTVGLVPGVAGPLTSALFTLLNEYPGIRLRIHEGYTGELESALAEGRIDLAVLNRYRAWGNNNYRRLFDAQLCVVGARPVLLQGLSASKGRPLSALPEHVSISQLGHLAFVLPTPPNAIRVLLDESASTHGLRLKPIMECGTSAAVKRMLLDHPCASILPSHAIRDEQVEGRLRAIPIVEKEYRQHVVLATSSHLPFIQAVRTVAKLIPVAAEQFFQDLATPVV